MSVTTTVSTERATHDPGPLEAGGVMLSIQIPPEFAEVLAPLDGYLIAEPCTIADMLQGEFWRVHNEMGAIAERVERGDLPADELRQVARRLDALAGAVERLTSGSGA